MEKNALGWVGVDPGSGFAQIAFKLHNNKGILFHALTVV